MEMPEGWLRLYGQYEVDEDGLTDDIQGDEKVTDVLDLMKEIAEALQIHVNGTIAQLKIDPPQAVGYEALKKFKEWK